MIIRACTLHNYVHRNDEIPCTNTNTSGNYEISRKFSKHTYHIWSTEKCNNRGKFFCESFTRLSGQFYFLQNESSFCRGDGNYCANNWTKVKSFKFFMTFVCAICIVNAISLFSITYFLAYCCINVNSFQLTLNKCCYVCHFLYELQAAMTVCCMFEWIKVATKSWNYNFNYLQLSIDDS